MTKKRLTIIMLLAVTVLTISMYVFENPSLTGFTSVLHVNNEASSKVKVRRSDPYFSHNDLTQVMPVAGVVKTNKIVTQAKSDIDSLVLEFEQ